MLVQTIPCFSPLIACVILKNMRWFALLKISKWAFHIIIGIHFPLRIDNHIHAEGALNEFLEGPVGNS